MRLFFVPFLFFYFILPYAKAQDTLPGFSAILKSNGKVLISWRNNYPVINQLSIQRSNDSLRNFTTLITVPDPRIPENGFVDSKAESTKMYYRIFILFPNSKYMFTKSRRAVEDLTKQQATVTKTAPKDKPTIQPGQIPKNNITPPENKTKITAAKPAIEEEKYLILPKIDNSRIYYMIESPETKQRSVSNTGKISPTSIEVEKILFVKKRDSVIMQLAGSQVRQFSDSLLKNTKDTLVFVNADTLRINPYVEVYIEPKEVYKISPYVFTSKDGNVNIVLKDCNQRNYFVAFYETDNTLVLELKNIKDPMLIIDKTNFGHSGWFRFELYEDGKLKEKNKLLIPKE